MCVAFVKVIVRKNLLVLYHHYTRSGLWGYPAGRVVLGKSAAESAADRLLWRTGYKIPAGKLTYSGISKDEYGVRFLQFTGNYSDLTLERDPQTEILWAADLGDNVHETTMVYHKRNKKGFW